MVGALPGRHSMGPTERYSSDVLDILGVYTSRIEQWGSAGLLRFQISRKASTELSTELLLEAGSW